MANHFKLNLLKRTLSSRDFQSFIKLLLAIGRSTMFGSQVLIFQLTPSDIKKVSSIHVADYVTKLILCWDMTNESLKDKFEKYKRYVMQDPATALRSGKWLWVGYLEDQVAHVAWTTTGDKVGKYFFPLSPDSVLISHCVTLPEYRGMGLFPATLLQVASTLANRGFKCFYIDCQAWNFPSRRGIELAGFRLIGLGKHKRNGRLVFYNQLRT
jgi:RimJ/RimL family protein N-acetyltransferase